MAVDLELERHGPLDELREALGKADDSALLIEAVAARTVVNLRGKGDESLVTDLQMALGVELPLMPNRWHGDQRVAALWLGPDEWLILASDGQAGDIERAVREARPDDPCLSLVDVSHNYSRLSLSGPRTRDVLANGCALDLRADAFGPGVCAQTLLAKAPVLLRALSDADAFELWFRNSYADYVVTWLMDTRAGL